MASNLTGAAATTSTYTLPSSIKTTNQAKKEEEQKVLNGDGGAMGQTAFLTLFTTQLQNQNPLDPMENEAFVAPRGDDQDVGQPAKPCRLHVE
jgi:flagellar hook assembly protein FlgD